MQLYVFLNTVDPNFAKIVLGGIAVLISYYLIVPGIRILRLPAFGPVSEKNQEKKLIEFRISRMKLNPIIVENNINVSNTSKDELERLNEVLKKHTKDIRHKFIQRVFTGTTIAQNGFVDAIIILYCSISMVKEIFESFNGRGSISDLITLSRTIITAIAMGGSDVAEQGAESAIESISQLSGKSLEAIPFAGAAAKSVADGYFNAILISRIGLITENYCSMTYLSKPSEIYPSYSKVLAETRAIVSNPISSLFSRFKKKG